MVKDNAVTLREQLSQEIADIRKDVRPWKGGSRKVRWLTKIIVFLLGNKSLIGRRNYNRSRYRSLFQFVMAINTVFFEIWEIVVTCDSSAIPINVLTTIIPIVISIAELAYYIGLGWKIYNEFGCVGAMVYFVYKIIEIL
ncbi:hypothetical protein F5890DRAFT_1646994 [Lentinula detonsa]|uniref:Transmembrane protein n=1 Tax=Lentinula detonsa TaxID=2804962 RepID=A0AA38PPJ0_9AGAR|nr:hypothetical protein F5890DRAFT_1646994 [Lentinula detonsa]